jgi:dihydroneopterin aldolase
MGAPRDLLETLAISMVEEIKAHYACKRIAVEIKKFTIPINEFSGNTAVRYEWKA